MKTLRTALGCSLALAAVVLALPSSAQVTEGSCILAGRLTLEQRWAPKLPGIELLAQDGKAVSGADKQQLASIKQVRLTQPALLSRCDGSRELTRADDQPVLPKTPVPAASAGPGLLAVEAVNFPKLRTGGELVELKLAVPAERVVMLTR
ncbi:MAG: hypothetical protein ACAH21_13465 [Ramlibacter sp.]